MSDPRQGTSTGRLDIPQYQVDAFTDQTFGGNPAAVCLLDAPLETDLMQKIAAENNVSETAFLVPRQDEPGSWDLRWFTPKVEVPLCGHATLATAHVLNTERAPVPEVLRFETLSGPLLVSKGEEGRYCMDFPAYDVGSRKIPPPELELMLKAPVLEYVAVDEPHGTMLAMTDSPERVQGLSFDPMELLALNIPCLVVTAPADVSGPWGCDFVSRFFGPAAGLPEDPVTGSAHCGLTPFWAKRLNKRALVARQVSPRGGHLHCSLSEDGSRVVVEGRAVTVVSGVLHVTA
ncbi:MAG: PhzF family phenazine biosynthesis protein [Rhodospirillaceae bacterium]